MKQIHATHDVPNCWSIGAKGNAAVLPHDLVGGFVVPLLQRPGAGDLVIVELDAVHDGTEEVGKQVAGPEKMQK